MSWPAVTATPLSVSVPAAGRVVMTALAKALAGVSLGSVKPKSAAGEDVVGVLVRGDRVVGAGRRVVDAGDVDGHAARVREGPSDTT